MRQDLVSNLIDDVYQIQFYFKKSIWMKLFGI